MDRLFAHLNAVAPFRIYLTGCVTPLGEGEIAQESFLKSYRSYSDALRKGELPDMSEYRTLSAIFTLSPIFYPPESGRQPAAAASGGNR